MAIIGTYLGNVSVGSRCVTDSHVTHAGTPLERPHTVALLFPPRSVRGGMLHASSIPLLAASPTPIGIPAPNLGNLADLLVGVA